MAPRVPQVFPKTNGEWCLLCNCYLQNHTKYDWDASLWACRKPIIDGAKQLGHKVLHLIRTSLQCLAF
jgi:hypothetical protein